MSRLRALAGVLLLALALAGCAGIPRDGDVGVGQPDAAPQDLQYDFLPSGPAAGASQRDILNGFIDAASSPQNNYKIAREFLASGAAWTPGEHVTVDEGQRTATTKSDSVLSLSLTPVAEVDATGVYADVATTAALTLDYGFVQEGGEWRISAPPSGVVIDRTTFGQVFSTHALYFFDPSYSYLVPDLRWFASRADSSTSTTIVTELLRGPTAWMRDSGAVVSAFPSGSALAAETVPVEAQRAVVDLNSAALGADQRQWRLMALQLNRSLANISNVTGVTLSVEQNPIEVPAEVTGLPTSPRVDTRPLVLTDQGFGFLGSSGLAELGISDRVRALSPRAAVLGVQKGTGSDASAVVLANAGVTVVAPGRPDLLLDARSGLVAPTVDPLGYVWSVPSSAPNQLVAYAGDGSTSFQVATAWSEIDSIASIAVSRDGTRMLALAQDGQQATVLVAGITRAGDGQPVAVGEPVVLRSTPGTAVAASWTDELDVASVVRSSNGEDTVTMDVVGGGETPLGTTSGTRQIAAGNASTQIRLLAEGGELRQQRGSAWQTIATQVRVLASQTGMGS
ncbi:MULTISPECIES: GerMN domain-containing protein [unclassified Rathayibacter]|uniref:GerMN domain-containing protein n=1 Tax=unclassified Rathayibacter TaxID=2609250 RepID=UPI00188AF86E|nr:MULTISPECIES: GerMN domain-containing protein [unclassified Rathayibacter]MBF4463370.1 GerMN domain-containing protein [Rathayibacter sp. VKM Ac-2879]MBF4504907.1 GerMN domain-containing protein [Rathayibacter sp. VKM Ac-2878]